MDQLVGCVCGGTLVTVTSVIFGTTQQVCARCGGALTPSGTYLPPDSGFTITPLPEPGETPLEAELRGLYRELARARARHDRPRVSALLALLARIDGDPREGREEDARPARPQ